MSSNIPRRGLMLVLSSPSGAGKTTLSRGLLANETNIVLSVPRPPRARSDRTRTKAADYFFVSRDAFDAAIEADEFLEYATVFDHLYGTPKKPVMDALAAGQDVLFDIDWQGTQQLKERAPARISSAYSSCRPPMTNSSAACVSAPRIPKMSCASVMSKAADEIRPLAGIRLCHRQ